MDEALEGLCVGGRGKRVDVVAHVACSVAVGGVAEYCVRGGADRLGVAWAGPMTRATPRRRDVPHGDLHHLTQPLPPTLLHGLQREPPELADMGATGAICT